MNARFIRLTATALVAPFLTSCATVDSGAVGSGVIGAFGGAATQVLRGERDITKIAAGAAIGAVAAIVVYQVYQANERQKAIAHERAMERLREENFQKKMRANRVRKTAVVVPGGKGQKKGVMIMDAQGRPVDGKVYVPENASTLQKDQAISLGGHHAQLANSWHGI